MQPRNKNKFGCKVEFAVGIAILFNRTTSSHERQQAEMHQRREGKEGGVSMRESERE